MFKKIVSFILSTLFVITPILQAEALTTNNASFTNTFMFNKNLMRGMTDSDVQKLQVVLNSDPQTRVAVTGPGSRGFETRFFGSLTYSAVVRFQEKYASEILTPQGFSHGTGYVGVGTRTKLNSVVSTYLNTTSGVTPAQTAQFVSDWTAVGAFGSNTGVVSGTNQVSNMPGCTNGNTFSTVNGQRCIYGNTTVLNNNTNINQPRVDLKANGGDGPINITAGQSVTLSWNSLNVTSCFEGSNPIAIVGSRTITPTVSGTYPVSCVNSSGDRAIDAVVVNIVSTTSAGSEPVMDLKVNGKDSDVSVSVGTPFSVSWTSSNTDYCTFGTTTQPVSGSFGYLISSVPIGQRFLDISMNCTGPGGTVSDVVIVNLPPAGSNGSVATSTASTSLAAQIAASTSTATVYFSGILHEAGKCWGEDAFYRVFVTPRDGQPVVSSVSGANGSDYGVGNPNATLKALYWVQGNIPAPVTGSTIIAESDGDKSYKCTYPGNSPGGEEFDGGVIFGVGQLPAGMDMASSTGSPLAAGTSGAASGEVPRDQASQAASQIKEKDSGAFGTGLSWAVIGAVAAGLACATGVGCIVAGLYYNSTLLVSATVMSAGAGYVGGSIADNNL